MSLELIFGQEIGEYLRLTTNIKIQYIRLLLSMRQYIGAGITGNVNDLAGNKQCKMCCSYTVIPTQQIKNKGGGGMTLIKEGGKHDRVLKGDPV